MTGFARVRKEIPQGELVFSLKSVNHRGLDLHFHLPPELDALENDIRAVIKSGVARGHLQIHCGITRTAAAGAAPLNRALLDCLHGGLPRSRRTLPGDRADPISTAPCAFPAC